MGLLAQIFTSFERPTSETEGHASLPTQPDRSRGPSSTLPWPQPSPSTARGAAFGTTSRFTGWGPLQVRSAWEVPGDRGWQGGQWARQKCWV